MLLALYRRLGSWNVELGANQIARAVRRLKLSRTYVDVARDDIDWARPIRWRRFSSIHLRHELRPRGCSESPALCIVHDFLRTIESHPHTGDEVSGVADKPDIR